MSPEMNSSAMTTTTGSKVQTSLHLLPIKYESYLLSNKPYDSSTYTISKKPGITNKWICHLGVYSVIGVIFPVTSLVLGFLQAWPFLPECVSPKIASHIKCSRRSG